MNFFFIYDNKIVRHRGELFATGIARSSTTTKLKDHGSIDCKSTILLLVKDRIKHPALLIEIFQVRFYLFRDKHLNSIIGSSLLYLFESQIFNLFQNMFQSNNPFVSFFFKAFHFDFRVRTSTAAKFAFVLLFCAYVSSFHHCMFVVSSSSRGRHRPDHRGTTSP